MASSSRSLLLGASSRALSSASYSSYTASASALRTVVRSACHAPAAVVSRSAGSAAATAALQTARSFSSSSSSRTCGGALGQKNTQRFQRTAGARGENALQRSWGQPVQMAADSRAAAHAESQQRDITQGGLDKIVKIELFRDVDKVEISRLWLEYHTGKKCLSAVLSGETYDKISKRSREAPMFVFPIPKPGGFESWLWVTQGDHCLISTLEEYKIHGANAAPHLHITFYPDLKEDKDVVLMRSEDVDTRYLSVSEAQYLANAWQLFLMDDERYKLMHDFNHKPSDFDFNRVVQLMDSVPTLATDPNCKIQ